MHPAERGERDAWLSLGSVPGFQTVEIGSVVCIAVPALADVPMVNHVVALGEDDPADDAVLDAVAAFYDDAGVRYYAAVTPAAQPSDLRDRLLARGFTRGYDWMKFARPVEPVPASATDLDVRLVGTEGGDDFARIVLDGYGMPAELEPAFAIVPSLEGFSAFVAYDNDEPAAAGALFVTDDVGWLGIAATAPRHRRKGGQSGILAARIARARELGVTTLVTETGVMLDGRPNNSYRNIVRSGFDELYVRENYLSP
jgi:GNAT superfamily N-acetyltransferase